jgi:hypothetical protein
MRGLTRDASLGGQPYEVPRSALVYMFDQSGAARLLISSLATATPDMVGSAAATTRRAPLGP